MKGYVITHFYDYFSKDTKFIVASECEKEQLIPIKFKEITYDEYKSYSEFLEGMFSDEWIEENEAYINYYIGARHLVGDFVCEFV